MLFYINGNAVNSYQALHHLLSNNLHCDQDELHAIFMKACTKQGEHQRDLIIADGIEIIID